MKRILNIILLLFIASNHGSIYAQASAVSDKPFSFDFSVSQNDSIPVKRQEIKKETPKQAALISDVDVNIPVSKNKSDKTFAVIIANENYRTESQVMFANNDGEIFRKYCLQTL